MDKQSRKHSIAWIKRAAAVVFWIFVWQAVVMILDKKSGNSMGGSLLVASPFETVKTLISSYGFAWNTYTWPSTAMCLIVSCHSWLLFVFGAR